MNNSDVFDILDNCEQDLISVNNIISSLGYTSNIVPYLTQYAIIKASGAIEVSFKTIIADYCSKRVKQQVKNYIDKTIRDSSYNPSYSNICNILKMFDDNWTRLFKQKINNHPDKEQIQIAFKSLVDARNNFAHGGNPTSSIGDIIQYFNHCKIAITELDSIIL